MGNTSGGMENEEPRFCICMYDETNNNDNENSKWILCEGCNKWYHTICVLMPDEEYEQIKKNNEKFYCEVLQCQEKKMENECTNPSQQLKSNVHEVECPLCPTSDKPKLYKGKKGLKIHCSKVHKSTQEPTNTAIPSSRTTMPEVKTTSEGKTDEVQCEICRKSYRDKKKLLTHKRQKHTASFSTKCETCGEIFDNERSFKSHKRIRHKQEYRSDIVKGFINDDELNPITNENDHVKKEETPKEAHQIKINNLNTEFEFLQHQFDNGTFGQKYDEFESLAKEAIKALPGPRHPAQKFFEARKRKETFVNVKRTFESTTNPERADKRAKTKSKQKYNYELCQYLYTNKRKTLVNTFLNADLKQCKIDTDILHESFTNRWSLENNAEWEHYDIIDEHEQKLLDEEYVAEITEEEVRATVHKVKFDNSAGPDNVIPRALKMFNFNTIMAIIFTIISTLNVVPSNFRKARTVLIDKGGDVFNTSNLRPISICSLVRRIFEKMLDQRLRKYIKFSFHQRGFINMPGAHINIALLESVLQKAKRCKMTCYIIFVDIKQAFDQIGHKHMIRTLHEARIPSSLRNVIINLIEGNYTQIRANNKSTKAIHFLKGILQGGPLSPTLFNMAIDKILNIISHPEIVTEHGFKLCEELENIILTCFADDTALIANSLQSAIFLTELTIKLLAKIGLEVNLNKCFAISIIDGVMQKESIPIYDSSITSIGPNDKIKYLGASFNDTIILDKEELITKFSKNLEVFTGSSLLHPNQKLTILNTYIWPTIIFKFQCTPLKLFTKSFLETFDKLLKSCMKEFIGLTEDIPNAMIYSPRKFKGLGLINVSWEAALQHINIMACLYKSKNEHLERTINFKDAIVLALKKLNIACNFDVNELITKLRPANILRNHLRQLQFEKWCDPIFYPYKHKGVETFALNSYTNKWIYDGYGLSTSTWTSAIKMIGQIAAVRGVPGRSKDGHQCRYCTESYTFESLSHVLGYCSRGSLLRNKRHNLVRSAIAEALRKKGYIVYEEKECIAQDGTTRRIDMIAINEKTKIGIILDPTVRFETGINQDEEVNLEKRSIYEPCIPDLKAMYDLNQIHVYGLLFGARGTVFNTYEKIRRDLSLPKLLSDTIVKIILDYSVKILHYHIHSID